MQEFFTIISNFGFPVAVASYLLFRFEKKLEALELANEQKIQKIDELTDDVKSLTRKINEMEKMIEKINK